MVFILNIKLFHEAFCPVDGNTDILEESTPIRIEKPVITHNNFVLICSDPLLLSGNIRL